MLSAFALPLILIAGVALYFILGFTIVPQSCEYIIERLGRFNRVLKAGPHMITPFIESVRYKVEILERQLPNCQMNVITKDNVTVMIDVAILYRISDPERAVYRIRNLDQALTTTVTGIIRSEVGKKEFDEIQSNREEISHKIYESLTETTLEWGIILSRTEIIDVTVDERTRAAMDLQLNAERERRAQVTKAEGEKTAAQLSAEGRKIATQLSAEAELYAAEMKAKAVRVAADAEAYRMKTVSDQLASGDRTAAILEIERIRATAIKDASAAPGGRVIMLPHHLGTVGGLAQMLATIQDEEKPTA